MLDGASLTLNGDGTMIAGLSINALNSPITSSAITVNTWNLITVTYIVTETYISSIFIYFGKNLVAFDTNTNSAPPDSATVRFGGGSGTYTGFLGKIYDIRIYSPGSNRVGSTFSSYFVFNLNRSLSFIIISNLSTRTWYASYNSNLSFL